MTLTSNVHDQDLAVPSGDELVARANAFIPELVRRQAETEERTYYAPDLHERFAAAGFYRILVPRRYGGYELGLGTFMRVTMALSRGCPSTGWMFCLGAAHALVVGSLFEEAAQREFFRDPDFICPAVVAPGGTAQRTASGWRLNGTWRYCSGAPYATYLLGHAIITDDQGSEPRPLMFMIPREQWKLLPDWGDQLGLKGTGSHSIQIENAEIPAEFAIETMLGEVDVSKGTPGTRLHGNPMYGAAPMSSMSIEGASIAVGMAQGALDAYTDLMLNRTTLFPPIVPRAQDPDYQRWYGQAVGMVDAAEAATLGVIARWDELCAAGPEVFTPEQDLRVAMVCKEAAELAWRAVAEVIFPTSGSSSVRTGERIERVWRDLSTGRSHAGFAIMLTTIGNRMLTKAKLGIT